MNVAGLIRSFRALSNDRVDPFFWDDPQVKDWLNEAQRQAAIRARLLQEDSLEAMCRVPLVPGKQTYKLHAKIYEIISLRLRSASGGKPQPLDLKSREWMDAERPGWREDVNPPRFAVQTDTALRVVGSVAAGDVLELDVYRLPLKELCGDGDVPEIHEAHHEHLVQWALHKAFSMPDAETLDPRRSADAEAAFTAYFGPLPDADLRRTTRVDQTHHNVGYIP